MKYLVVTGGVVSGLGKGISISSIGVLLKAHGLRVTSIKIDPYLVRCVPGAHVTATAGCAAAEAGRALVPDARTHCGRGWRANSGATCARPRGPLTPRPLHLCALQNSDAGTMSPFEHGEVFVLNDGGEVRIVRVTCTRPGAPGPALTPPFPFPSPSPPPPSQADLDLGNYERFLDVTLTRDHNITTGKVYSQVINAERRGDYLGKTVQVIPHVTDAVQNWMDRVSHLIVDSHVVGGTEEEDTPADVCLVEVGGTVGDIESHVFLEALRQFQFRVGTNNMCFVHVSLVPVLGSVGEQKTKPTQHTVKELRSVGLNPDIILCRSAQKLSTSTREKLALFCQVAPANVVTVHDVSNIYHVPLLLQEQGVADIVMARLQLAPRHPPQLQPWIDLAHKIDTYTEEVRIALVGKYTGLQDSYLSVIKSLQHAAVAVGRRLVVEWIDATALEAGSKATDPEAYEKSWETVKACHGILVPGGFGDRGVEGKIAAVRYARESKTPFLGICLGMQCAVIEYARCVPCAAARVARCPLTLPAPSTSQLRAGLEHGQLGRVRLQVVAPCSYLHARDLSDADGRDDAAGGAADDAQGRGDAGSGLVRTRVEAGVGAPPAPVRGEPGVRARADGRGPRVCRRGRPRSAHGDCGARP